MGRLACVVVPGGPQPTQEEDGLEAKTGETGRRSPEFPIRMTFPDMFLLTVPWVTNCSMVRCSCVSMT